MHVSLFALLFTFSWLCRIIEFQNVSYIKKVQIEISINKIFVKFESTKSWLISVLTHVPKKEQKVQIA